MPGSVTSFFSEPDEFQAALHHQGVFNLLVTSSGQFRARLTQVRLHDVHLSVCDEQLPRIAFFAVPAGMVLVSFSIKDQPAPIWGGVELTARDMITLRSGERFHARTEGRSCWGAIQLSHRSLVQYSRALSGTKLDLPTAARWRPPRAALRQLRQFHLSAIRATEGRSGALIDNEVAHGLEQQVIHALIECLIAGTGENEPLVGRQHRGILARIEDLLGAKPFARLSEIRAALGISEPTTFECCSSHLGMGLNRYLHLRKMQQLHRALLSTDPRPMSVSAVAKQHGIRDLSRFAAGYRDLYGEYPSYTLRRRH